MGECELVNVMGATPHIMHASGRLTAVLQELTKVYWLPLNNFYSVYNKFWAVYHIYLFKHKYMLE